MSRTRPPGRWSRRSRRPTGHQLAQVTCGTLNCTDAGSTATSAGVNVLNGLSAVADAALVLRSGGDVSACAAE